MAQPLEPVTPVLPGRSPQRRRVPGRGAGEREDGADAEKDPPDADLADGPDGSDGDHFVDDYA